METLYFEDLGSASPTPGPAALTVGPQDAVQAHRAERKKGLSSLKTTSGVGWGGVVVGGGGGGCQNFFASCSSCVSIWTQFRGDFFLVHGLPNPWQGSRVQTQGTPRRPPP